MTVSLVGTPTGQSSFAASHTRTVPTGVVPGDLAIVISGSARAHGSEINDLDWTLWNLFETTPGSLSSSDAEMFVFTSTNVTGGDSVLVEDDSGSAQNMSTGIIAFHSTLGTPEIAASSAATTSTTGAAGATAPDISVTADGILLWAGNVALVPDGAWTPPTGYTERIDTHRTNSNLGVATKPVTAGGTSGAAAGAYSGGTGRWIGLHMLITDPTGGGTPSVASLPLYVVEAGLTLAGPCDEYVVDGSLNLL